jgi:hypothetical protein
MWDLGEGLAQGRTGNHFGMLVKLGVVVNVTRGCWKRLKSVGCPGNKDLVVGVEAAYSISKGPCGIAPGCVAGQTGEDVDVVIGLARVAAICRQSGCHLCVEWLLRMGMIGWRWWAWGNSGPSTV